VGAKKAGATQLLPCKKANCEENRLMYSLHIAIWFCVASNFVKKRPNAADFLPRFRTTQNKIALIHSIGVFPCIVVSAKNGLAFAVFLHNCCVGKKPYAPMGACGFHLLALAQKSSQMQDRFQLKQLMKGGCFRVVFSAIQGQPPFCV
jgi:hypothetical protein